MIGERIFRADLYQVAPDFLGFVRFAEMAAPANRGASPQLTLF
jgi:hypothetical protein